MTRDFPHRIVVLLLLAVIAGFVLTSAARADPLTAELEGGESIFSQNSWYYYGQVGVFSPLNLKTSTGHASDNPSVGTAATSGPTLHLFVQVNDLVYLTSPAPTPHSFDSYQGVNPAVGIRFPIPGGFVEGDAGMAIAEAFQPFSPVTVQTGLFLQGEFYRSLGPGAFDLFADYTGYIAFAYVQGRYLIPVYQGPHFSLFAGPEDIGEFSYNYWAGQGGGVIGLQVPAIKSYLTFDAGLLRSSAGEGAGGYEGFSWYVSF